MQVKAGIKNRFVNTLRGKSSKLWHFREPWRIWSWWQLMYEWVQHGARARSKWTAKILRFRCFSFIQLMVFRSDSRFFFRGKNWFNTFQLTSVVGRKNHKIAISLNQEDQCFIILGQEHLRSICGAIQAAGLSDVWKWGTEFSNANYHHVSACTNLQL